MSGDVNGGPGDPGDTEGTDMTDRADVPLDRYRQLLGQLLRLNEQAAALRRELDAFSESPGGGSAGAGAVGAVGSVGSARELRELRVLGLIENVREYCRDPPERRRERGRPVQTVAALMKLSFDEEHRTLLARLGGLQTLASLVAADDGDPEDPQLVAVRKYAGMALTNLTFGDGDNKASLCRRPDFMTSLVRQLDSPDEDVKQVTAAVLRNLSWRADPASKRVLRQAGAVKALTRTAMSVAKESTLKSTLSALWNLTAHCSTNKADVCAVDGALAFLVDALSYRAPSGTLAVVENAGGILKNLSSHVAVREDYRQILRDRDCLKTLLRQLRSPSLTVVGNSCGTLWNLSARCPRDQQYLRECGAVPMLRSLVHSRHGTIATGSGAALKNLVGARQRPGGDGGPDPGGRPDGSPADATPGRPARPLARRASSGGRRGPRSVADVAFGPDADGRDSVVSARSDSAYEKSARRRRLGPEGDGPGVVRALSENGGASFDFERPTDYSRKYPETAGPSGDGGPGPSEDVAVYGDYRETDLDEPTDYSLRYSEERSDAAPDALAQEDTMKHFCTEGTPYETPVNFSTATSVTDLRAIPPDPTRAVPPEKRPGREASSEPIETARLTVDVPAPKADRRPSRPGTVSYDTKFGSGLQSPEKPTNYCEEGTPGYFSRISSLSSLDEIDINHERGDWPSEKNVECEKQDFKIEPAEDNSERKKDDVAEVSLSTAPTLLNFAEETPLMFSRCSSLGSISEFSIHGHADDVGSVVSEFSRLTSGCLSPSELPDSPTQSPAPRNERPTSQIPLVDPSKGLGRSDVPNNQSSSVFEDGTLTYRFEHTPVGFSTATSLSSLTIDEDASGKIRLLKSFDKQKRSSGVGCSNPSDLRPIDDMYEIATSDCSNNSHLSENVLEACINAGVQSSLKPKVSNAPRAKNIEPAISALSDVCHTYCTEDTPALLSKVGSNSDLSVLSLTEVEDSEFNRPVEFQDCNKETKSKDYLVNDSKNRIQNNYIASKIPKINSQTYLIPDDETEKYAVEGTPIQHSLSSSLSDLTIASKGQKAKLIKRINGGNKEYVMKNNELSPTGSLSSISIASDDDKLLDMAIEAGIHQHMNKSKKSNSPEKKQNHNSKKKKSFSVDAENNVSLVRNNSLSSLSDDSLDSNDCEQAIFEECIKSGMPKVSDKLKFNVFTSPDKLPKNTSDARKKNISTRTGNDEFESLVTAGAFGGCSKTVSKTHSGTKDRMLLEEVINCGIPKKKILNIDFANVGSTKDCYLNLNPPESKNIPVSDMKSAESKIELKADGCSSKLAKLKHSQQTLLNDTISTIDLSMSSLKITNEPFVSSNQSGNGESSKNAVEPLPDLLRKSMSRDEKKQPDLTDKLMEDDYENMSFHNGTRDESFDLFHHKSNDPLSKSILIKNEAARLALMVKNNCGADSTDKYKSFDLDDIRPPSQMENVISITSNCSEIPVFNSENDSNGGHSFQISLLNESQIDLVDSTLSLSNIGHEQNSTFNYDLSYSTNAEDTGPLSFPEQASKTLLCNSIVENSLNETEPCSSTSFSSNETIKKHHTPKEKRLLAKDRYKTYTIVADPLTDQVFSVDDSINVSVRMSPKQKRRSNKLRYQTQTISPFQYKLVNGGNMDDFHVQISQDASKALELLQNQTVEDQSFQNIDCETMSLISEDDSELNSLQMKNFTRSFRNYLPVIESPTSVDKCIKENLKNINISSLYGNKNDFECSSNESERNCTFDIVDVTGNQSPETNGPVAKPKIVKPQKGFKAKLETTASGDDTAKCVKGRKKKPYVSPYKLCDAISKKIPSSKVISACKGVKMNGITAKTNKNPAGLKKPVNLVCKIPSQTKSNPQKEPEGCKKPAVLVRQGTFTKEDTEATKSSLPCVYTSEKLSENSSAPQPNGNSCTSAKRPPNKIPISTKTNKDKAAKTNCSSSTHSLLSNESAVTVTKSPSCTAKSTTKNVADKVSSLWKRVEESKRQQSKRDTRVWIEPQTQTKPKDQQEAPSKTKLTRSSTFESSPKPSSSLIPTPFKQKSSINITVSQQRAGKYVSRVPVKSKP